MADTQVQPTTGYEVRFTASGVVGTAPTPHSSEKSDTTPDTSSTPQKDESS